MSKNSKYELHCNKKHDLHQLCNGDFHQSCEIFPTLRLKCCSTAVYSVLILVDGRIRGLYTENYLTSEITASQ